MPTSMIRLEGSRRRVCEDHVATEEPLELRIAVAGITTNLAVTMRTPGADFELAAGFLLGEGVIRTTADILDIRYCVDGATGELQHYNVVTVELAAGLRPDLRPLERHFTTSACGVCGKASLDALQLPPGPGLPDGPVVPQALLFALPERMRQAQGIFQTTGGLHAAGLFDAEGTLLAVREDVGRHNALDKLIGWALMEGRLPLHQHIILVSGQASFELAQKAVAAGVPILCAVSAPSSLAVAVARRFTMTLVGFLRDQRCNIYSGEQRIEPPKTSLVYGTAKGRAGTSPGSQNQRS